MMDIMEHPNHDRTQLVKTKKKFLLVGNYGTFELWKVVEAFDEDEAYEHTGFMIDLEAVGWTMSTPDGEEWTITEVTG